MKLFLKTLNYLFFPINIFRKPVKIKYECIHLHGKRVVLTDNYPLASAKIVKGGIYNVVDEYVCKNQVTSFAAIPIKFLEILNDDQEPVLVSSVYFKEYK